VAWRKYPTSATRPPELWAFDPKIQFREIGLFSGALSLKGTGSDVAARGPMLFTRTANCFFALAGLIPIALVAWYVVTQGSQVPSGDAWWDPVYIAVKTRTGTLIPEDFFVLNAGHRPAVTRLITVFSTIFTDYDAGVLRFAAFTITLLNLGLTMLLLRGRQGLIPISFFLSATVLFSLYSPPNWLDMCYSPWQQALFFVLLGLLILQRVRPGWPAFAFLMLCATAASFSMASGLVAWISLLIAAIGMSEYRRPPYVMLWLLVMVLFWIFYTSDYAVHPFRTDWESPSLNRAFGDGLISPMIYLFRYQAVRFDTPKIAPLLALISSLVLGINWWQIMRSKNGVATAALWGSLALYTAGTAALVLLARGTFVTQRQSPGADGFWLAFIALSLLVLARRPPVHVAILNVSLLVALVIFSVRKDIWTLQYDLHANPCDQSQSIVDYPLYRDGRFHECFIWSEDQSVYHLAALRLSVFRNEALLLILPRTDAPVITDMPNRWLSVYVRDYMLAGLPWQDLYSIAPVPGVWSQRAEPYTTPYNRGAYASPYNRGEWPTDILPQPLQQTWESPSRLASDLSILTLNQPMLWYLNTPETEANFLIIERAFTELDYTASKFAIREARYASAHFGLWCFERKGSGRCAQARVQQSGRGLMESTIQ
jgi:hypothetical protein